MAQQILEIKTAQGSRRVRLGKEPVSIGRQVGNTVVIDDVEASRNHCVFERINAGIQVRDLGSRNGTKVNGERVNTALILDGDVVTIGKTEMRVIAFPADELRRLCRKYPVLRERIQSTATRDDMAACDISPTERVKALEAENARLRTALSSLVLAKLGL